MARHDLSLDQMRLRLHAAHTHVLEVQLAADRRWGRRSALSERARGALASLTTALDAVDELVRRGES